MTTTVTVEAHCDSETTEVRVTVGGVDTIIQDGETHTDYVYDMVGIVVQEVPKAGQAAQAAIGDGDTPPDPNGG